MMNKNNIVAYEDYLLKKEWGIGLAFGMSLIVLAGAMIAYAVHKCSPFPFIADILLPLILGSGLNALVNRAELMHIATIKRCRELDPIPSQQISTSPHPFDIGSSGRWLLTLGEPKMMNKDKIVAYEDRFLKKEVGIRLAFGMSLIVLIGAMITYVVDKCSQFPFIADISLPLILGSGLYALVNRAELMHIATLKRYRELDPIQPAATPSGADRAVGALRR